MPGTQFEHRQDDEAEHQQVAQNHEQPGGEQLIEGVDVGSEPRDQTAHRVAIVEGDIQPLQMPHQLAAQIEHGLLSDPLHQVLLAEVAEHGADQRREVKEGDLDQPFPGVACEIRIDQ